MNTQNLFLPVAERSYSAHSNIFTRFIQWCETQQEKRLSWLGTILALQGCVITPITLFFVTVSGINPVLLSLTICSIVMNLVVNLAAMPTKITVPVFILSLLVSAGVIAAAFISGVNLSAAF